MTETRTPSGLIVAPDMLQHSLGEPSEEEKLRLHNELRKLMEQIESCEKAGFVIEHHAALDSTGLCAVLLLASDVVMAYTMWKNGVFPEPPTPKTPELQVITE